MEESVIVNERLMRLLSDGGQDGKGAGRVPSIVSAKRSQRWRLFFVAVCGRCSFRNDHGFTLAGAIWHGNYQAVNV